MKRLEAQAWATFLKTVAHLGTLCLNVTRVVLALLGASHVVDVLVGWVALQVCKRSTIYSVDKRNSHFGDVCDLCFGRRGIQTSRGIRYIFASKSGK